MKEAKERGPGAVKKDWEPRLTEARYLGQHARTGAIIGIIADGIVCGRLGRLPEAERWDQTGWQDLEGVPLDLRRMCQRWRSLLRLSQAQPRQSEERECGRDPWKEQSQRGRETKHPDEECKRRKQQQHQHQRQMQQRRSHLPKELEVETLERVSSMMMMMMTLKEVRLSVGVITPRKKSVRTRAACSVGKACTYTRLN